jgi:hypothetical protein
MAFTSWLVVASMAFTATEVGVITVELGDGGGGERREMADSGAAARAFSHSI